jgi:hypothetical protein
MTQDEIIEMARQSASHGVEDHRSGEVSYVFYNEHLMNFAKLVAQHERDKCAYRAGIALLGADRGLSNRVDQAIRARGQA